MYLDPDKIQEAILALRFLPPKMSGTIPPISLFMAPERQIIGSSYMNQGSCSKEVAEGTGLEPA